MAFKTVITTLSDSFSIRDRYGLGKLPFCVYRYDSEKNAYVFMSFGIDCDHPGEFYIVWNDHVRQMAAFPTRRSNVLDTDPEKIFEIQDIHIAEGFEGDNASLVELLEQAFTDFEVIFNEKRYIFKVVISKNLCFYKGDIVEYEKITDAERYASALTSLRLEYLTEDYGVLTTEETALIGEKLPDYFRAHLGRDLFAYVCREGEDIAGCCFLYISEKPPNPAFITGKTGTVLNVYTRPQFRKRGIAATLMIMLLADSAEMGLDFVELKATDDGYELYRSLGFEEIAGKYRNMKFIIDKRSRL